MPRFPDLASHVLHTELRANNPAERLLENPDMMDSALTGQGDGTEHGRIMPTTGTVRTKNQGCGRS